MTNLECGLFIELLPLVMILLSRIVFKLNFFTMCKNILNKVSIVLVIVFTAQPASANGCSEGSTAEGPSLKEYSKIWETKYKDTSYTDQLLEAKKVGDSDISVRQLEAAWLLHGLLSNKLDIESRKIAIIELSKLRDRLGRGVNRNKIYVCYNFLANMDYVAKYYQGYTYFEPAGGYIYDPEQLARELLADLSIPERTEILLSLFLEMEGDIGNLDAGYPRRFEILIEESQGYPIQKTVMLEALTIELYNIECPYISKARKSKSKEKSLALYKLIEASGDKSTIEIAKFRMDGIASNQLNNLDQFRAEDLCRKWVDP